MMVYACDRCGALQGRGIVVTHSIKVLMNKEGDPYHADLCEVCLKVHDRMEASVHRFAKEAMSEYMKGYFDERKTDEGVEEKGPVASEKGHDTEGVESVQEGHIYDSGSKGKAQVAEDVPQTPGG